MTERMVMTATAFSMVSLRERTICFSTWNLSWSQQPWCKGIIPKVSFTTTLVSDNILFTIILVSESNNILSTTIFTCRSHFSTIPLASIG